MRYQTKPTVNMNYKKLAILFIVFLGMHLLSLKDAICQNYYEDSYPTLKDSIYYPLIDSILSSGNYSGLSNVGNEAFNYYFDHGQKDRATYLFNVTHYYPLAIGMGEKIMPEIENKIRFLRQNTDTFNVHYATLNHIASFGYKYNDEFEKAKPHILTAIKIYENKTTPLLHKSSAYYNYGGIIISEGDFYKAYQMYIKALEGFTSDFDTLPPYHDYFRIHDAATTYLGIAFGMQETGQVLLTEAFNLKAYKTLSGYPRTEVLAVCEANLSSDYIRLKQYDKAIPYADSALFYVEKESFQNYLTDVYITSLKNLGIAFGKKGDVEKGIAYLTKASDFLIENYPDWKDELAGIFASIAEIYFENRSFDKSQEFYNKALSYSPDNIDVNIKFSQALTETGNYNRAIEELKRNENKSSFSNNAKINSLLAENYYTKYLKTNNIEDLKNSLSFANKGNELIVDHLNNTILGDDELTLSEKNHNISEIAIKSSYELFNKTNNISYLENFIRTINQSTANKLTIDMGHLSNESSDEYSYKQLDILKKIRTQENLLLALQPNEDEKLYNNIYEELTRLRIEAFELSYSIKQDKKYNTGNLSNSLNINNVKKLLNNNEAVIQFFLANDGVYSSLIQQNTIKIFHTASSDINDQIKAYYKSLKTGSKDLNTNSHILYNTLFANLINHLKGINRLIIIPDDILNQIPLEPLVSNIKTGEMLINDYSFVYNYSLFIWMTSREKYVDKIDNFIGFAPVFDKNKNQEISLLDRRIFETFPILRSESQLDHLPFSAIEVTSIAQLFQKSGYSSSIYINENATEQNFKKFSENKSIIHIATHGYSSISDPELSCLYFYQGENNNHIYTDEGIVYNR